MTVDRGPSESGPRIGGDAPEGIAPPGDDSTVKYFGTIPLTDQEEISIFLSQDFERWLAQVFTMTRAESGSAVRIIGHGVSARGPATNYSSPIDAARFALQEEQNDLQYDPQASEYHMPEYLPTCGHKLGGEPFRIQGMMSFRGPYEQLRGEGWLQVVQFDMAKFDRSEPGDGYLRIYGLPPFKGTQWYWLWEW